MPTTLSNSFDITRTANEYTTTYSTPIPDTIFNIPEYTGHLQYTLQIHQNTPYLHITTNPDENEYAEHTTLITGQTTLPLPRDIIETTLPTTLTNWEQTNNGFQAPLDISAAPTISGDALAHGNQPIQQQGDTYELTLPKHELIPDYPACTISLTHTPDGYELAITLTQPTNHTTPITNSNTIPRIELPNTLVHALNTDTIPVTIYDGGPLTTRPIHIDTYPAQYGTTHATDITHTDTKTTIPLPTPATNKLDTEGITTGALRLSPDNGTPLLIFDSHHTNPNTKFHIKNNTIHIPRNYARFLAPQLTSTLHWHYHDGALIAEPVHEHPIPHPPTDTAIAHHTDNTLELPSDIYTASNLPDTPHHHVTAADDTLAITLTPETGRPLTTTTNNDTTALELPDTTTQTIPTNNDTTILCQTNQNTPLTCTPMPENEARKHISTTNPEDITDSRLHIPEDGRNSFIQSFGDTNPVVALPTDAIDQFNLEEGSKFQLHVGTYDGALALKATPIADDEDTPNICLGRMLTQKDLRLPIQLVVTLSLFDRTITWGINWEPDGPQLIGLIEDIGDIPLNNGQDVGTGTIYTATKNTTSYETSHFTITISKTAFDIFQTHPPGVFVACDSINNELRLILSPIGEEDLDLNGAVKLRDHWDDDYYELTIPKNLATALNLTGKEQTAWTYLDGQFIATLENTHNFN